VLDVRVEIRLEALLLAARPAEEGIALRVVGESPRNDVDVEVRGAGARLPVLDPKAEAFGSTTYVASNALRVLL